MGDVTLLLEQIDAGHRHASSELLPLVYNELRKLAAARMAHERPGQTLQATALVHEAYVRLVDQKRVQNWSSRGHFLAAAAEAMRRILIEQARRKRSLKRGGAGKRVDLQSVPDPEVGGSDVDILELDEALEQLSVIAPEQVELVKLRFFAGLSIEDAAAALGISAATAKRQWVYARAWLFGALKKSRESASQPDQGVAEGN